MYDSLEFKRCLCSSEFLENPFPTPSASIEDEDIINHTRKGLNLRQNKVEIVRRRSEWMNDSSSYISRRNHYPNSVFMCTLLNGLKIQQCGRIRYALGVNWSFFSSSSPEKGYRINEIIARLIPWIRRQCTVRYTSKHSLKAAIKR